MPASPSSPPHAVNSDAERRKFLTQATCGLGILGGMFAAAPFVESWWPSERAYALGQAIVLDPSKIEPGEMLVVVWRRQPIYVVRRTAAMVAQLVNHDAELKDPDGGDSDQPDFARNAVRARRAELFVAVGICTHLGCLPRSRFEAEPEPFDPHWPGGFLCPCHGSRFDLAGRVFIGSPAPRNLAIPPYAFTTTGLLMIGDDVGAAAS